MFIIAKPDSLSVVMVVRRYPLTSFNSKLYSVFSLVVFLWRKRFSFTEQQRLNLVMNTLHLRLTVFILYFNKFLTLVVLI